MTAYIGMCLKEGVFLASDSRRTHKKYNEEYFENGIKKIHRLTDSIVIGIGGLGTIGHMARKQLTDQISGKDLTVNEILKIAKPIFSTAWEMSLLQYPDHKEHLYAIFAGYDKVTQQGFIKVLDETTSFDVSCLVTNYGQPYFTGTNTNLVINLASGEILNRYNSGDKFINLDMWAYNSFRHISRYDSHVAFPIDLFMVGNNGIISKKIISDYTISDPNFKVPMPNIPGDSV